jgi:hypothetical protein
MQQRAIGIVLVVLLVAVAFLGWRVVDQQQQIDQLKSPTGEVSQVGVLLAQRIATLESRLNTVCREAQVRFC